MSDSERGIFAGDCTSDLTNNDSGDAISCWPEQEYICLRNTQFHARFKAGSEAGGDFADCFELDENRVAVIIGDAAGTDIQSGATAMMCKNFIRWQLSEGTSPSRVFRKLNAMMMNNPDQEIYASAIIIIINSHTQELSISNAGHERPLIIKSDRVIELSDADLMLGVSEKAEYGEQCIKFESSDRLFMFTNGLITIDNGRGDRFGRERLHRLLDWNKILNTEALLLRLFQRISDFTSKNSDCCASDDMAALVINLSREEEHIVEEIKLELPAVESSLKLAREAVDFAGERFELPAAQTSNISEATESIMRKSISILRGYSHVHYIHMTLRCSQKCIAVELACTADLNRRTDATSTQHNNGEQRPMSNFFDDAEMIDSMEITGDPKTGTLITLKKYLDTGDIS